MRERFAHLLNGFSALGARGGMSPGPLMARIRFLLEQFSERRARAEKLEDGDTTGDREHSPDPGEARECFASFLNAYSVVATRDRASATAHTARIRSLLDDFRERNGRAESLERAQTAFECDKFHALLDSYNETLEGYRQKQEEVADDFSLLDVMRLTGKEIRHSMVLAWLLDHDMRNLGTHAQGSLGFRLFLSEFGLPIGYADHKYWVRREVAGDESIVDIVIACRDKFLIYIENKIWSSEGTVQTDREWSDLKRRAEDLKVGANDIYALYLTPRGTTPVNPNFRAISWGRVVRVIEAFANRAKPQDVRLFAAHYARALHRFIVIQEISEDDNAERTLE